MIKNREIIREIPINEREVLNINNDKKDMVYFKKYEKEDKLEELKNICIEYNKDSGMGDITTKTYIIEKVLEIKMDISNMDMNIFDIIRDKQKKRRYNIRFPILPAEECNR